MSAPLTSLLEAGPMLATSAGLPTGDDWVFEGKWDGVRALIARGAGPGISAWSRNKLETTGSWPELQQLDDVLPPGTLLDAELVTLVDGAPSFERLQQRMHVRRPPERLQIEVPLSVMIFDLLMYDGSPIVDLPWSARREVLQSLALPASVSVPPAFPGPGADVLEACTALGLEGVVAKRVTSTYRPGRRSADWIKVKSRLQQEFVVGGWQPGEGGRTGTVGSLAVGVVDSGELRYAGQVGSGLSGRLLADVERQLAGLTRTDPPFTAGLTAAAVRGLRWVEPVLVCQVAFTAWTAEGRLRHPTFKGLRNDKPAGDVVREPTGQGG